MKDTMNADPAPAAKPAAKEEVGCDDATATTAPTATRPKRSGRETATGGTAGSIGTARGYYRRLNVEEGAMNKGIWVLGASAVLAVACGSSKSATTTGAGMKATANIESRSGSKASGKAEFTELASGGTRVQVWIENATPGTHGLHLHEKGDCSAPDATSAGGHFNAAGNPHAAPTDAARHNGDLGNIEIGGDGKGHLDVTSDLLTVSPGPNSVKGKAVVFHEKADDMKTQPTGNAGARFGCGVVQ